MAETNTSNIGFEKQTWNAACVLCGDMDTSEYRPVVLGLIFLKYISDCFEAKMAGYWNRDSACSLKKMKPLKRKRGERFCGKKRIRAPPHLDLPLVHH